MSSCLHDDDHGHSCQGGCSPVHQFWSNHCGKDCAQTRRKEEGDLIFFSTSVEMTTSTYTDKQQGKENLNLTFQENLTAIVTHVLQSGYPLTSAQNV